MNIEELKRLAEAATPGPWEAWPIGDYPPLFSIATETGLGLLTTTTEAENEREFAAVFEDEDAAYIAAANPAAILELIEENKHLKELLDDDAFRKMRDDRDLLQRQRDELLAALRHLYHNAKKSGAEMGLGLDVARAAIAKAEG